MTKQKEKDNMYSSGCRFVLDGIGVPDKDNWYVKEDVCPSAVFADPKRA